VSSLNANPLVLLAELTPSKKETKLCASVMVETINKTEVGANKVAITDRHVIYIFRAFLIFIKKVRGDTAQKLVVLKSLGRGLI